MIIQRSLPYIRLADAQMGPNGDCSILYDFRLCEPNTTALPPTTLHSLEHSLLAILPQVLPGFLMVAPMGCRTGLYIITAFPLQKNYIKQQVIIALERICTLETVPYQSEKTCGMARDHDLKAAQAIAATVLKNYLQVRFKKSLVTCVKLYFVYVRRNYVYCQGNYDYSYEIRKTNNIFAPDNDNTLTIRN